VDSSSLPAEGLTGDVDGRVVVGAVLTGDVEG
jgi:hypothetical protein